ncbi:9525_t:CDS:10 [Cetraspora pellucida]|uniref:9525_t:CDS:1 n=1 Tax=Cetraspora pellucida TaxID=1433469 RepID=A0A9N8VSH5_9GLOM|nr:9525_t:CDS:10 [Cetraspora pellucida]
MIFSHLNFGIWYLNPKSSKMKQSGSIVNRINRRSIINSTITKRKNVLLLGSGFVSKPLVDYLVRQKDLKLIIASNSRADAISLIRNHKEIDIVDLDVMNQENLNKIIQGSDVVVSLIPANLHPIVAEACIKHKKNMVTASYISSAMRELDNRAKQAGITILNEIGVDPGIDHLSAMKIIDDIKAKGGEVTSFISWCGGLPAPEASKVPLKYKFSWSPRGVLIAALNDAHFWMNGKKHKILGGELLKSHFPTVPIDSKYEFEGLANRDSLSYIDTYGLAPLETKNAMLRGTLRYKGFSDLMYSFLKLGLLKTDPENVQHNSWPDFLDYVLFGPSPTTKPVMESRIHKIKEKLDLSEKNQLMVDNVVEALKNLSLLEDPNQTTTNLINPPKIGSLSPLDTFCILLQDKLKYYPGEKDLLVLYHEFEIKLKNGDKVTKTSKLITDGIFGSTETYTAMAKTVGLPAAIATEMIARGEIHDKGVLAPTLPNIYNPILEKLDYEGIKIEESIIEKGMRENLKWSGSGIWN